MFLGLMFIFSHSTFAKLGDIDVLGGSYYQVFDAKNDYLKSHPDDNNVYECHHLIARAAMDRFRDQMFFFNKYNDFLLDESHGSVPPITMDKCDHEKTLSYFDLKARINMKNRRAEEYIDYQAEVLCNEGNIVGLIKKDFW